MGKKKSKHNYELMLLQIEELKRDISKFKKDNDIRLKYWSAIIIALIACLISTSFAIIAITTL